MLNKLKNRLKEIRDYWVIKRSGLFDREYYLRNNLDVARSCKNPIMHYIRHGWREGRNPNKYFNTNWYLKTYPDVSQAGLNPLYHYIKLGKNRERCNENIIPMPSLKSQSGNLIPRPAFTANVNRTITSDLVGEIHNNIHRELFNYLKP